MKIGMLLPSAGQQATRENIIHAAMQAEEERFDSRGGKIIATNLTPIYYGKYSI